MHIVRRLAAAVFAAAALIVLAGAPATAQMDFLKRGTEILRGIPGSGSGSASLSDGEIVLGLREALRVGTERVVGKVGALDGFNNDPRIHIPLTDSLRTVQTTLARVGLSSMVDDLELRLNRAAEAAAPEAQALFWNAIETMTWDDVRQLLDGPDDAANPYLERTMSSPLVERMTPIVDASLAEVGAIRAYDSAIARYRSFPLVPDVKADLTQHVLERALHGLFLYLAEEEAAILHDPAKRTTELL
jgi:hypothetical protein